MANANMDVAKLADIRSGVCQGINTDPGVLTGNMNWSANWAWEIAPRQ